MSRYLAHIMINKEGRMEQTLEDHSRSAASIAEKDLAVAGLGKTAYFAGILHDMGKYTDEFQSYLQNAVEGNSVKRGSVNHTFAGARFLLENYHPELDADPITCLTSEILSFAVGSHHGLFDCVDENGKDGLEYRLTRETYDYQQAVERFMENCLERQEVDFLFQAARKEMITSVEAIQNLVEKSQKEEELYFYLGLLARLVTAAVVDGDRQDTAEFLLQNKYPEYPENRRGIWTECLHRFLNKLESLPKETEIQKARRCFSDQCAKLAEKPAGIYRLSLPTGAGKTLASMRAALSCAAAQNKSRIIYAIPLLSVLDQNAKVIREFLGDDSLILEHHSNVLQEGKRNGELSERELLMENWNSPVIITTLVQLFLALFDGKMGAVRRMQALCNSVLVIDEVQSVPTRLLSLFNLAMNYLATVCHTTILLCSATQPCLESTAHALYKTPEELVPYRSEEWSVFRRTIIGLPQTFSISEIASAVEDGLAGSLLLVCNTKKEAAEIYSQIQGVEKYHLSGSMCMAHRQNVLTQIEAALADHRDFICVSTQLIEAGVDVSFGKAVRLMAGLDNILQTAGRCNRNGESREPVEVFVFRCRDEKLNMLKDIQNAQNAAEALFEEYAFHPEAFGNDVSSDKAVRFYYEHLYKGLADEAQDGPVKGGASLLKLGSQVDKYLDKCGTSYKYCLRQSLAESGDRFQVFPQDTVDVVAPYREGADIIADLCSERAKYDMSFLAEAVKRAKPYMVSLFQNQKDKMAKEGKLKEVNGVFVLYEYDNELGIGSSESKLEFQEV